MKAWRVVAVCWLCIGTSATAFDLPEGDVYVDETSIDDWLDAGVLRYDEWEQLREWATNPMATPPARDEFELLPDVIPPTRKEPPFYESNGGYPYNEPIYDLARYQPREYQHRRVYAYQRFSNTLRDADTATARGFVEYVPSFGTTIGFANVSGDDSRSWDDRLRTVRRQDPSRLVSGYLSRDTVDRDTGRGWRFLVGDYGLSYGHGLVLNTARRRYLDGYAPNGTPTARERGAVAQYGNRRASATAFVSRNTLPASLSPAESGLSTTATVANAVERRLAGFHLQARPARKSAAFHEHRFGVTVVAHDDKSRSGVPLAGAIGNVRTVVGLDGYGHDRGFQWRGEAAYANGFAGWAEVTRSIYRFKTNLAFHTLGTGYQNALTNRKGDRQGADVRATYTTSRSVKLGARYASEQRLSTRVTSQQSRIWCSTPTHRRIRGSVAYAWRRPDVFRPENASRTDFGARAGFKRWDIRTRLTERWNPRRNEWTANVAWFSPLSLRIGAGVRVDRTPSTGGYLKELNGTIAGEPHRNVNVRLAVIRRWQADGTRPATTLRLSVDGAWGSVYRQ